MAVAKKSPAKKAAPVEGTVLSVFIGDEEVKAVLLDAEGNALSGYETMGIGTATDPAQLSLLIQTLAAKFPAFDKVSVGFPGYVKAGVVLTAPNLLTRIWKGFALADKLQELLNRPVKVVNDADLQGLGVVKGEGFELVITLGKGFGTALFMDGVLLPHIELAHHTVTKNRTYDLYIGEKSLEEVGEARWNIRMKKVLAMLRNIFNYDHLYIGGSNAKELTFRLPANVSLIKNENDGFKGGARLWSK